MKYLVIVKNVQDSEEKPKHGRDSLPNKAVANKIMDAVGFREYVAEHGYHFTPKLATLASGLMKNANGHTHSWTPTQIEETLRIHGFKDIGTCTIGDITYLANMAYADFYPDILKDELSCIKYAIAVAKDPDGYDGIAFSRWVSDIIGKAMTNIEWEKYNV